MSQLESSHEEGVPLPCGKVSSLLVYSGLQLIGWGPPFLGKAICFIQATYKC